MTTLLGWLVGSLAGVAIFRLGYHTGQLAELKRSRTALAESHLAQHIAFATLRSQLRPWIGEQPEVRS